MKHFYKILLITAITSLIIFSGCGTVEPIDNTSGKSVSKVLQTLDTVRKKFIEIAKSDLALTPGEVLSKTEEWLSKEPEVKKSFAMDDAFLKFTLQSGLEGYFTINLTDGNGLSLTRGGSKEAQDIPLTPQVKSENVLKNKKVLIFSPFVSDDWYASLYKESEAEIIANKIKSYDNEFEVTNLYKKDENDGKHARAIKELESMGNYGLVILNTHGLPDGFFTTSWVYGLDKQFDTTEALIKEGIDYKRPGTYDQILKGYFNFAHYTNLANLKNWREFLDEKSLDPPVFYLVVTSKFIKSIPSLENTIIVGNMCYSGWNLKQIEKPKLGGGNYTIEYEPIREGFLSRKPIAYYAYSFPNGESAKVGNKFAKAMEDSLTRSLIKNLDSTGRAYKNSKEEEFTGKQVNEDVSPNLPFKLFGADNYSYDDCMKEIIDVRDGQKYKVVCIGEQIWMAENLRYNAPGSVVYKNENSLLSIYGRLYDWKTVMNGASASSANPSGVEGICPKGWHIPSQAEWEKLLNEVGNDGGKLKDTTRWNPPNTGATNRFGFTALPGGIQEQPPISTFNWLGMAGFFWSTDVSTAQKETHRMTLYLHFQTNIGYMSDFPINAKASCRCIKD